MKKWEPKGSLGLEALSPYRWNVDKGNVGIVKPQKAIEVVREAGIRRFL